MRSNNVSKIFNSLEAEWKARKPVKENKVDAKLTTKVQKYKMFRGEGETASSNKRRLVQIIPLIAILILANCGASDFASQLRVILTASGPLINSLNLGDKKAAVVQDFTDLASGAADLSVDLKACNVDKACKLDAVSRYETRFWDVIRRGHFKLSPKLQTIENILGGIISAAKVYYGGNRPQSASAGPVPASNPASDLDARLKELKAAMRVN